MSLLDETTGVARRTMTLFFLVDTSGSMAGTKIGAVNDAITNVIPMLGDISANNSDAEIRVAALTFASGTDWLYDAAKPANDFVWQDAMAGGLTAMGEMCRQLEQKLHRGKGFIDGPAGSYAPAIILLSDGAPTDDFDNGLDKLKANNWFKAAIKVAIAIGDDADKDVLARFTGSPESVITVHNLEALKQIIRIVSVTSSQVASQSSSAGTGNGSNGASGSNTGTGNTKQDQVNANLEEQTKNIPGAETAVDAPDSSGYDEWA